MRQLTIFLKQTLKSVQKLCAHFTFLNIAHDMFISFWQIIYRWKDKKELCENYFSNFLIEEAKWKWKKWTFFLLNEKFSYSLYKNFKLRRFQICNHLFDIFTGSKDTACQSWSKKPKMGILGLLWKAVSFDPVNI